MMYRIYNNNPEFGDCGPFDIEAETFEAACERLADEMEPQLREASRIWAYERLALVEAESGEHVGDVEGWISDDVFERREALMQGLTQIIRCPTCGQHYHQDAAERGHAGDCEEV